MEPADLHSRLNIKDLRHCYDCVSDQINMFMDRWEQGRHKDADLDAYIDTLCDVRDKISKILNDPKLRTF